MIEIQNKKMLLLPRERVIGAAGDVDTASLTFCMDRLQDGCDLSPMVAFLKVQPVKSSEAAYNQLLQKKTCEDRIILTWRLTGKNMKDRGEISVQIMLVSPDYFDAEELSALDAGDLVLPAMITGASAPVWQSYRENFVIADSIDDTVAYQEITKNVLTAAVAAAAGSARDANDAYQDMQTLSATIVQRLASADEVLASMRETQSATESCRDGAEGSRQAAEQSAAAAATSEKSAQAILESTQAVRDNIGTRLENYEQRCQNAVDAAGQSEKNAAASATEAAGHAELAENYMQVFIDETYNVQQAAQQMKEAGEYRLLYQKTVAADEELSSFEITKDADGNDLWLSSFVIYYTIPKMENAGSTYLRMEIQGAGNSRNGEPFYSQIAQFSGLNKTAAVFQRVECVQKGRWVTQVAQGASWDQNAESVTPHGGVCGQQRAVDGKPAVALRLAQHTNVQQAFPAGTFIEVWGKTSLANKNA